MSSSIEIDQITVTEQEQGNRIDKLLNERFDGYSRTYFQYLIDNGYVLLNGAKVKKRITPVKDDEIQIFFQLTEEISLEPENIPLNILYEDDHIIAVNKPVGMVVHPGAGNWSSTFVNALLYHCKNQIDVDGTLRPGIVHRLDKNTSGVLIAAKTQKAHRSLISCFSERKAQKMYLAICVGDVKSQTIDAPIGRHPKNRKEMTILKQGGKEAISHVHLLAKNDQLSLVLVRPKTGRTHQIRVHLKSINAPILGDTTYGNASVNKSFNIDRQLLHAYKLTVPHPVTNLPLNLVAPIPNDIKNLLTFFAELTSTL